MAGCSVAPINVVHARNLLDEKPSNSIGRTKKTITDFGFGSKTCPLMVPQSISLMSVAASNRNHAKRRVRGRQLNASELAEGQSSLEQDGLLAEWGYQLPASLDWLWSLPSSVDVPSPGRPSPGTGCRWVGMGVIFELEGVIVEPDDPELESYAWFLLCEEEGKDVPPSIVLRSMEGMKVEEAMSDVLGWSNDPLELQRLASRKEEIYRCLQQGVYCLRQGTQEFLNRLVDYGIPMAVVSTRPRKILEEAIQSVALEGYFACMVAAEDLGRGKPDPEMFKRAAELLDLESEHCIVIGNSDSTVVAADAAGMSSVVVASKKPVYDFQLAKRVVRWLDELSIADLEYSRIDPIQQRAREMHMEMEGSH